VQCIEKNKVTKKGIPPSCSKSYIPLLLTFPNQVVIGWLLLMGYDHPTCNQIMYDKGCQINMGIGIKKEERRNQI
jgi:hypothetical protein